MREKKSGTNPKKERRDIGTPAGESPASGRQRHGTECLTDVCDTGDDIRQRKLVDEDPDNLTDDELNTDGEELSTTGGITGTHVRGGIPAGGTLGGGTPTKPAQTTAEGRTESQKGATSA